ncbi:hypothetical protein BLTE_33770 [Blastochloris tepida]|uniref:Uncharacterized protein n=1 Tax=Blastochloris tepida TaxID=2233851 RepID=A0A348G559_9HYPH|nr:hypothetical protein BLTE_33770 [Blastochloris tepida]
MTRTPNTIPMGEDHTPPFSKRPHPKNVPVREPNPASDVDPGGKLPHPGASAGTRDRGEVPQEIPEQNKRVRKRIGRIDPGGVDAWLGCLAHRSPQVDYR